MTVRVERAGDEIVWRDLASSAPGDEHGTWHHFPEDYRDVGELRFNGAAYRLNHAARARAPARAATRTRSLLVQGDSDAGANDA